MLLILFNIVLFNNFITFVCIYLKKSFILYL